MDSLFLSFRVVFPMFCLLAIGYVSRNTGLLEEWVYNACSTAVFQLIMPINLFMSISGTPLKKSMELTTFILIVVGTIIAWLAGMILVPIFEKENRKRGVLVQGFFRSNILLFGFVIAESLSGPETLSAAAVATAIAVPVCNTLAVISLESFRGGKPDLKGILGSILKNPLVIGAVCAFIYLGIGWKMPNVLHDVLADVAAIATPLALIALGGTFRFSALKGNARQLICIVLIKLVCVPAMILSVAVALGLRDSQLAALLCVFGTPVATAMFPMSQRMGGDGELAGQIVVSTVTFSIFSLCLWVLVLNAFGLC